MLRCTLGTGDCNLHVTIAGYVIMDDRTVMLQSQQIGGILEFTIFYSIYLTFVKVKVKTEKESKFACLVINRKENI